MDWFGIVGSFLLVVCAFPQFIKTFKTKEVDDLSLSFFIIWFFGCLMMLIYTFFLPVVRYPLFLDYIVSSIVSCGMIILIFKYRKW